MLNKTKANQLSENQIQDENELFTNMLLLYQNPPSSKIKDEDIYTIPQIPNEKISNIIKRLNSHDLPMDCIGELAEIFVFDPAFLSGYLNSEFGEIHGHLGIIANVIGWLNTPEIQFDEYFILIVQSILSFLKKKFDINICYSLLLLLQYISIYGKEKIDLNILQSIISYLKESQPLLKMKIIQLKFLEALLQIATHFKFSSLYQELSSFCTLILSSNHEEYQNYDFSKIIILSSDHLPDIEYNIMVIFLSIADFSSNPLFVSIYSKMAKLITNRLKEIEATREPLTFPFEESLKTQFPLLGPPIPIKIPEVPNSYLFNENSFQCFPGALDPLSARDFESSKTINDILTESEYSLLLYFQSIIHRINRALPTAFITAFSNEVRLLYHKPDGIILFIFFITFLKSLPDFKMNADIIETIVLHPVFSHLYSIFFSTREQFAYTNLLRNMAFEALGENWVEFFAQVIEYASVDPLLFAENLGRIYYRVEYSDVNIFFSKDSGTRVGSVLRYLVFLANQEQNPIFFKAWSTFILFLSSSLEDHNFASKCFESFRFSSVFLSFMYNSSLMPIFSGIFRNFLLQCDPLNDDLVGPLKFCTHAFNSFQAEDEQKKVSALSQTMLTNLLDLIEDVMIQNPSIVKPFSSIIPSVLGFLFACPSPILFKNTMMFLLSSSSNLDNLFLTQSDMIKLGTVFKQMGEELANTMGESSISMLLSLVSGRKVTAMNAVYPIANPTALVLLLLASSDNIVPIINHIDTLCKESIYNCIQCHKGEFDLFLIELIHQFPNPFTYFGCTFNHSFTYEDLNQLIFPLLNRILTFHCSPQTITKLYQAALPNKDGEFPKISELIIDQLNVLSTVTTTNLQIVFSPHCKPKSYTVQLDKIKDGFTFSCYFMFDRLLASQAQVGFKQILFALIDNNQKDNPNLSKSLFLYLSGNRIVSDLVTPTGSSSARMIDLSLTGQWILISYGITFSDEIGTLSFAINKEQSLLFNLKNPEFVGPTLTLLVGGYATFISPSTSAIPSSSSFSSSNSLLAINTLPSSDSINNTFEIISQDTNDSQSIIAYLGDFWLFDKPLTNELVNSLFNGGIHEVSCANNLLANDNPDEYNGYIISFRHAFKRFHCYKVLLPFFQYLNTAPPCFLDRIVGLFYGVKKEKIFSIISKFLLDADPTKLTYSLYLQFFKLSMKLNSPALIKDILFKFELWFAAPAKEVQRIVYHWNKMLFPSFSNFIVETIGFDTILAESRVFFWIGHEESETIAGYHNPNIIYSPSNDGIIDNRMRALDLDAEYCREQINQILAQIAAIKLTEDNITCLLSNIFTLHDPLQLKSLLQLLNSIAPYVPDPPDLAKKLLFLTTRPTLFADTLFTIMALAGVERGNHIDVILANTNSYHYTSEVLNSIYPVLDKYPEVSPIVAMISLSLSFEDQKHASNLIFQKTFDTIDASCISKIQSWFLWFILLAISLKSYANKSPLPESDSIPKDELFDPSNTIIKAISNILNATLDFKMIDNVFGFIDLLELMWKINIMPMRLQLLESICDNIIQQKNHKNATEIFYRCSRNILYSFHSLNHQFYESHNPILLELFSQSPFNPQTIDLSPQDNQILKTPIRNFQEIATFISMFPTKFDYSYSRVSSESKISIELIFSPLVTSNQFESIITRINGLIPYVDSSKDSVSHYLQCFNYLNNKSNISKEEKFSISSSLITRVPRYTQVMNISYSEYFAFFINHLLQYFEDTMKTAQDTLISLPDSTIDRSASTISANELSRFRIYAQANNQLQKLIFQNSSLYPSQTSKMSTFSYRKSLKLDSDLAAPFQEISLNTIPFELGKIVVTEKDAFHANCNMITLSGPIPCKFILMSSKIIIITATKMHQLLLIHLSYVLPRGLTGRMSAVEFISDSGNTYLIDFDPMPAANLISIIQTLYVNPKAVIQRTLARGFLGLPITNDWLSNKLNNFQYIMQLSYLGGRTYHSTNLYPIFPDPFSICNINSEASESSSGNDTITEIEAKVWLQFFSNFKPLFQVPQTPSFSLIHRVRSFDVSTSDDSSDQTQTVNQNEFLHLFEQRKYELTPEFFAAGDCFEGIPLPAFAEGNCWKFVYEMRKKLESTEVTSRLCDWIDRIFGVRQQKNVGSPAIFSKPHPHKTFSPQFYPKAEIFSFGMPHVQNASIYIGSSSSILIYAIGNHGNIQTISINISEHPRYSQLRSIEENDAEKNEEGSLITPRKIYEDMINTSFKVFSGVKEGIVFANCQESLFESLFSQEFSQINMDLMPVSMMEADGYNLMCAAPDSIAYYMEFFDNKENPKRWYLKTVFDTFGEVPTCVFARYKKQTAVVGVASGFVFMYDINSGRLRCKIDLNGKVPQKVLITKRWGFILVQSGKWIGQYSINGKMIAEKEIESEITIWKAFASPSGFDYVLISNETGLIGFLEAMNLKFVEKKLRDFHEKVIAMEVSNKINGAMVVMQNGDAALFPLPFPSA